MMRIKRALLAVMLLLVLGSVYGCGNKDVTGNDTGENEKYKNVNTK